MDLINRDREFWIGAAVYRMSDKSRIKETILGKYVEPNLLCKIHENMIHWLTKRIKHQGEHAEYMLYINTKLSVCSFTVIGS